MKTTNIKLVRYDADEGKVFDWAKPCVDKDENGNEVVIHLYVKTLFIGANDSIDNYIEVSAPDKEVE